MIGIYKIISPSNVINIGQTWNWESRQNDYKKLQCKGRKENYKNLKFKYYIDGNPE